MHQTMEALVADFQERALPLLTPRRLSLPALAGKADAVLGMRRSGKTFFLYQQILELEKRGVPRRRMLYVNFEDERLLPLKAEHLALLPEAFYRRFPENREDVCWFFFDEIQNVPGWERFVRRLLDTEKVRIVLTGSSAKLLGKEIATSLRGRSLASELLPFSFEEALRHSGIAIPDRWPPAARTRSTLEHAFLDYLERGGFPEVQKLPPEIRSRIHQDYVDVVVLRDVIERYDVANPAALRYVVRRLLSGPASSFTVHRLFNDLRSQGLRAQKDSLYDYVRHLEDAFLFFTVEVDSRSARVRMSRPRKCYLIDPGLARSFSYRTAGDLGRLLKNVVYLELRRRGYTMNYVVTKGGHEVDFLASRAQRPAELIQVCASLDEAGARERELRALTEGLQDGSAENATVVTLHEEGSVELDRRRVGIVPAWQWLLAPNRYLE